MEMLKMKYRTRIYYSDTQKEVMISPDIQYIRNPALNPDEDALRVFGIRARFAF
jgi:carbohydrate-selective porin OprB